MDDSKAASSLKRHRHDLQNIHSGALHHFQAALKVSLFSPAVAQNLGLGLSESFKFQVLPDLVKLSHLLGLFYLQAS